MATLTRVFVARLAGLPVYDPNGDQVGRVRDVVARLRPDGPPAVVGLVATATSPSARDGSCLFSVYTWQTRDRLIVSRPTSMTCTPLFAG